VRGRNPYDGKPQLTLRDVAEKAHVSEMTVSRVLRNRGDVSEKTRERVFLAARELGYVPNKIAGALASNRVNLVGVVIPSLSNLVFPDVLTGITEALDDTPLQPVVGATNYSPEREEKVLYEMLSWRPSGVIVAGIEHEGAARAMLANAGVPVVQIMDTDGEEIDAVVGISHIAAGARMADEILARGYKRIGFLCYYEGGSGLGKGREMTAEILERTPDLDFLYYSNDMIGAGGMLYCLEKRLSVPDDLGLAGFNAYEILDGFPLRLATMDTHRVAIGQAAAKIIADRMAGIPSETRIELDATFDPGGTMRAR
jgi:LacI family gluconate utilization system Gnt-I transcriptional repressor